MSNQTFPRAVVVGTGSSVPDKVLTNAELETLVDTSHDWIMQRTGIRERRISTPDQATADFCEIAANRAMEAGGITPAQLDLVIVATVTGDYIWPSTACLLQNRIGAVNAGAFDVSAACSGFVYGMSMSSAYIATGQAKTILLVGADCLSKLIDWTDRTTCILFGDGAGAVVITGTESRERGVIASVLQADGKGAKYIILERGGNRHPMNDPRSADRSSHIYMDGKVVYRFAIEAMCQSCAAVIQKAGMTTADIDLFVPHQANLRIIESASERLGIPREKVFLNVERYGNTSGASIPLALDEAVREGRLQPGMVVLTVGFGAGLVWGANIIRW